MRRWIVPLLLVTLVGAGAAAQSIEDYHVSIQLRSDASVFIVEEIVMRFDLPRRGFIRDIPISFRLPTGERYNLRVRVDTITADRSPVPVRETRSGGVLSLRIGDPDRQVLGVVRYAIAYEIQRALRTYDDEVELYWNAVGHDWQMPIDQASVALTLPPELSEEDVRFEAFQGPAGSRDPFALEWVDGTLVGATEDLGLGRGVTVVLRLPKDSVSLPGAGQGFLWFIADNWYAGIPFLVLVSMTGMWWYRGRDPEKGSISPVFTRLPGLGPAEAGVIIDDHADPRDLSAGIVDLAVKGHMKIREVWEEGDTKEPSDFLFVRAEGGKPPTAFEAALLEAVLGDADERALSDLKYKLHAKVPGLKASLYMDLTERGYYDGNPEHVRTGYRTAGTVGLIAGAASGIYVASLYLGASIAASGLIVLGFARLMPRKTHKGAEVLRTVLGLEEYIARAEVERMEHAAQERHFEELLPYAIAFGLTEVWAKHFEGLLRQPPNWYEGRFPVFAPHMFGMRMLVFQRAARTAAVTAPRTPSSGGGWRGGSGFGGGGFSGGGMGGGGGRAW